MQWLDVGVNNDRTVANLGALTLWPVVIRVENVVSDVLSGYIYSIWIYGLMRTEDSKEC